MALKPVKRVQRDTAFQAPAVKAAPFWRRLIADLIDLTLLVGLGYGLWVAGVIAPGALPEQHYDWIDYTAELLANHLHLFTPTLILVPTVGLIYGVVTHTLLERTLGEAVTGLRLIASDGGPAGPIRSLIHAAVTPVGVGLLMLGYAWAAVDLKRQGLAEYASGTRLIAGHPGPP